MSNFDDKTQAFEDKLRSAADTVVESLDRAVDNAGKMLDGEKGKKIAGGAAIGALAAVVLPISLIGGALIGAGYAAYRQMNK
jgi:hypothetical protein